MFFSRLASLKLSSFPRTRPELGWREACGRAEVLMIAGEFGYVYETQI